MEGCSTGLLQPFWNSCYCISWEICIIVLMTFHFVWWLILCIFLSVIQVVDGKFTAASQMSANHQGNTLPYGIVIHNPQAALLLIQWLPDIQSHHLQTWLSDSLRVLCMASNHNRIQACTHGMIHAIIGVLQREKQVNRQAIGKWMYRLYDAHSHWYFMEMFMN